MDWAHRTGAVCDHIPVTADLIDLARAGDGEAFRQLVGPYERELRAHCYRMLGSVQDAEDAMQDALLAAWQGLSGFEGRASVRTWLYRVTTTRCLNVRRSARVTVRAWGLEGETVEVEAEGFEAVVFQHELDHLEGVLFLDRIADVKTDLFRRKPRPSGGV